MLSKNRSMKMQKSVRQDSSLIDINAAADLSDAIEYSSSFGEYVNQRRVLLGCGPVLYHKGLVMSTPTCGQVILSPGWYENVLLFIYHNHPLFKCFYCIETRLLGVHGVRFIFIAKEIVGFVLFQFSHMILNYWKLNILGFGTIVNLFVITPCVVTVGGLVTYLYTCPLIETIHFQEKYGHYEKFVRFLGLLAILPIIFLMGISLIMACLFRCALTHLLAYSLTHLLTHSLTYLLTHSVMDIESRTF